jgi:hypothetical protein
MTAFAFIALASAGAAQNKSTGNAAKYDVTITAGGAVYTGTMDLSTAAGKVSGDMRITKPTEVTGKPAGTVKAGAMKLDFAYRMVQNACDGQIQMDIKMPAKPGAAPATGTVVIAGCGRPAGDTLPGTIELKPQAAAKKK